MCTVCVWCVRYVVCYEACVFLILPGCTPPSNLLLVLLLIFCSFHPLPPESPTSPCAGHTHVQTHTRSLIFFSHLCLLFPCFLLGASKSSGLQRGRQRETCRERWRDGGGGWCGGGGSGWEMRLCPSVCPSHSPQPSLAGAFTTHCQTCASLRVCPVGHRALPSAHLSIRLCVCLCCPASPLLWCH